MRVDVDREGNWTWIYCSEKPNDAVIAQLRSLKSAHGGKYTTKATRRKKYGTPGAWYIRTWIDPKCVDSIMAMQGLVPDAEPFDPHPEIEDRRGRVSLTWGYNEPGPLDAVTSSTREPGSKAKAVIDYALVKSLATTQVKHGVEFTSYPVMPSDVKNQTDAYLKYAIKLHEENRPKTGGDERKMVYDYVPSWIKPILPSLRDTEKVDDPVVLLKWFTPDSSWTWFITEVQQEDEEAFGLVDGHEAELGYVNIEEMAQVVGPRGLHIERDLHWTPVRLSQIRGKSRGSWPTATPEPEELEEVPAYTITDTMGTVLLDTRVVTDEVVEEVNDYDMEPEVSAVVVNEPVSVSPTAEAYAELDLWFEGNVKQCKRAISECDNVVVLEYATSQPMVARDPKKVMLIERKIKKLRKEAV